MLRFTIPKQINKYECIYKFPHHYRIKQILSLCSNSRAKVLSLYIIRKIPIIRLLTFPPNSSIIKFTAMAEVLVFMLG